LEGLKSRDVTGTFHVGSTVSDGYYCSQEKVIQTPPLRPAEWSTGAA
jgi:hypothetical protein